MPVAIERPNGRLVDLLLEAGHPVVPVSPNAIKTWRDGEVLSGAKSDAGDAAVIAEYLRLRAHRLRAAAPYCDADLGAAHRRAHPRRPGRHAGRGDQPAVRAAGRALARREGRLRRRRVADRLAFLTRYPTAAAAAHLGEKRMAAFCVKNGYSGRRTAAELLARLRAAPAGTADEALTEALRDAVLAAVGVLHGSERRGEEPRPLGGRPPRGAPGREDLHVAAKVGSDQRRPGARRVGRLPQAYDGPDAVAASPASPGHQRVGQAPGRALPLGCNKRFRGAITPSPKQPARQPLGRKIYSDARAAARTTHASGPRRAWIRVIGAAGSTASPTTADTARGEQSGKNRAGHAPSCTCADQGLHGLDAPSQDAIVKRYQL